MSNATQPIIAVTLGDPNGIGPEVALRALESSSLPSEARWVLVGSPKALQPVADVSDLPVWNPAQSGAPEDLISLWDPSPDLPLNLKIGTVQKDAGVCAAAWIKAATEECVAGTFAGLVTAPVNKQGLKLAGEAFPGHTEMLAELGGVRRYGMVLMGGPLNVILVTRHLPLKDVAAAVTRESVLETIALIQEAHTWLDLSDEPIAVCGLNPHAGDGGTLGREEMDIITPAIEDAKARGWNVVGPIPSDTVFHFAVRGKFSCLVCMYHDQGLGPLKMLAFDEGVNVTIGLPFVRTSPDHGTAYNIAGTNCARPNSMLEAMTKAYTLCQRPNPWCP